ncbi:MAG: hypothetical protein ACI8WB_004125, partial [Phenylobacterium sp.]
MKMRLTAEHHSENTMTGNTQELDLMAIEAVRRQTRPLSINIELGNDNNCLNDDYLRVTSIEGQESVSESYQFNVELRADEYNPVDVSKSDATAAFANASS